MRTPDQNQFAHLPIDCEAENHKRWMLDRVSLPTADGLLDALNSLQTGSCGSAADEPKLSWSAGFSGIPRSASRRRLVGAFEP